MKILITGASGFLGSKIAQKSIAQGHEIFCLRHEDIKKRQAEINKFTPEILVHCAWGGVSADDRNNPQIQNSNLIFSKEVVNLYDFKQIIALGSQDEYGYVNEIVNENHELLPLSEYARYKVFFCDYLREYAERKGIEWQWIRIFNMYGEGQSDKWLIPSIILRCLKGEKTMQVTKGEQKYAYLHSDDLARAIVNLYGVKDKSGIYNLSSSYPLSLKNIFLTIKKITNSNIEFVFGALPYRKNQSMMICGDSQKFKENFGDFEYITFEEGIKKILNYYKNYG